MKLMVVHQALRGAEITPEPAARICYRSCEPRATQELSGIDACWLHLQTLHFCQRIGQFSCPACSIWWCESGDAARSFQICCDDIYNLKVAPQERAAPL